MPKLAFQLTAYLAAVVGIVILVHDILAVQIGLRWIVVGLLGLPALGIALIRFPAAFVVPVLFVPQLRELPILSRFDDSGYFTVLAVSLALACAALFIRLATLCTRGNSVFDLFRGQRRPIAGYLLFASIVAASYAYTASPTYGGDKLIRFLCIGVPLFFAPFVLFLRDQDVTHFTGAALLMGLALATQRLLSTLQGSTLAPGQNVTHIGMGQLMGMAMLVTLGHKVFQDARYRLLVWFLALWLGAGLISAEARGPLISLLIALGVSVLIRRWNRASDISGRLALGLALIGLTAVLLAAYWFHGSAMRRFTDKTTEVLELAQDSSNFKGTAGRRLLFYRSAWHAFADKPLFGWGIGGWSAYYFHTDDRHYPHNLLLEVGVEQGVLGLVALILLLAVIFLRLKKAVIDSGGQCAMFLIVLSYSLSLTMFSGDLDDSRFLWFWCGAALAACRLLSDSPQERSYVLS